LTARRYSGYISVAGMWKKAEYSIDKKLFR
jgi:hypothetical protein